MCESESEPESGSEQDWDVGFERVPSVDFAADGVSFTIHNVRNFRYPAEGEHLSAWESRSYRLDQACCVDFIVVPFSGRLDLAHTMVSFGFDDGRYIVISVEARRRKGQRYSVLRGLFWQYPIMHVIADERDAIGIRTESRGNIVQLYRSSATPKESACLLKGMLQRTAELSCKLEYYNTIFNNCLTNIRWHVNQIWPKRVPWHSALLLTARSDYFAFRLGLLKADETFETMREKAAINQLVKEHWHDQDFSQKIRSRILSGPK